VFKAVSIVFKAISSKVNLMLHSFKNLPAHAGRNPINSSTAWKFLYEAASVRKTFLSLQGLGKLKFNVSKIVFPLFFKGGLRRFLFLSKWELNHGSWMRLL